MLRMALIALSFALTMTFTSVASASAPPRARQAKQLKRIHKGAKSGELTQRETRKALKQQRRVNRTVRRARADGKVTRTERRRMNRKQNRASRNIYGKKQNARRR